MNSFLRNVIARREAEQFEALTKSPAELFPPERDGRQCEVCEAPLVAKNRTGRCIACRPRTQRASARQLLPMSAVLEVMRERRAGWAPAELAKRLEISAPAAQQALARAKRKGLVMKLGLAQWTLVSP